MNPALVTIRVDHLQPLPFFCQHFKRHAFIHGKPDIVTGSRSRTGVGGAAGPNTDRRPWCTGEAEVMSAGVKAKPLSDEERRRLDKILKDDNA